MNIVKINKALTVYIDKVKKISIPDVFELYQVFGKDIMGREIVNFDKTDKKKKYFNKSVIHKKDLSYIGLSQEGFYSETIMKHFEEFRTIVINGIGHNTNSENIELVEKIRNKFKIDNFIMDCFSFDDIDFEHKIGKEGIMLMELNEIHLSSLEKGQLDFLYQQIL